MARILLLDDDDSFREMLRKTLAYFGHIVMEARNGKEGLELLGGVGADLLITDIVMPEKEGIGVLLELRRTKSTVKVIAMSGGGRQSANAYLRMAAFLGATRVLAKPFSQAELLAAIGEVLSNPPPTPPPD
jgi:DNA-binding response OmpR family regulator